MRLIILLFLFLSYEGSAQVWHMKRQIQYDNSAEESKSYFPGFISFTGEVPKDHESKLSLFTELLPVNVEFSGVILSIVYPVYEPFQGIITDPSLLSELTDTLNYSYSLELMKKKPFLQLSLSPFRINPENGVFERLKSFVIRIESENSTAKGPDRQKKAHFQQNSVLATGNWYKIRVDNQGMYKLSYEQISAMSVGDPAKVRIFGYGGEMLPEDCRKGEKDDLIPIQIHMVKGNDGIFNSGDYILFYSRGTVKWNYDSQYAMFRHQLNPYSDFTYYFITTGDTPDLPLNENTPSEIANRSANSYDYRTFHEKETQNVLLTGKQWFGEYFALTLQHTFNFVIPDLVLSQPVEIATKVMAKSLDSSFFQLSYNNLLVSTFGVNPSNLSDYTSIFGFTAEGKNQITPVSNNLSFRLKYIRTEGKAEGWLDYITINARANLSLQNDFLDFRDIGSTGTGNITQFLISGAKSKTIVWDVSDLNGIRKVDINLSGSDLSFKVATDTLREFIAFNEDGNFSAPVLQGKDLGILANQNLHGSQQPDMVIIAYADFMQEAERLAAYRREKGGMDVLLVTPELVYNEFSSGTPDIAAFRNFMKMLYNRAGSDSTLLPRYLLLFGDGTYDNKGITENATNYVLTFQSDNSLSPTASYVSDDFFGLLDPGESMITGLLDIGVGRLPVGTSAEAEMMVNKILDYELPSRMGDWRNAICFIGDDEDSNIHLTDADGMANRVETKYPGFNLNKIYLDAYKQVSASIGQRYPEVNYAINSQVEKGALIINYTGHGGIKGWAHELILGTNEIDSWKNYNRLPLFVTATCEFSRYDDHIIPSAGEKVLLNPNGGGIALLTTTRLVYSQPNRVLNEKFYEIVFEKDQEGKHYTLGDIMQYTKNKAGSGINKRNFTLLGDPSQRLAYPEYFVYADSINGMSVTESKDTIQALSKVSITGHLADIEGNRLTGFNGVVYPTIYDKAIFQQTLANDGGSKKTFRIRNNILYKGKSSVKNGEFNFEFIVPKDINYAIGNGRLSFYAADSVTDASGSYDGIIIGGGTNLEAAIDQDGPELRIFMNNPAFRSGGITDENPLLYVEVYDESGINTTGNGIGHDITAVLDEENHNVFMLNSYFQASLDNYKGGIITYPFSMLEPGHHSVNVKVWDIYNNSSTGTADFIVIKSEDLILEDLLNYPNPFSDYTNISFGHNSPGVDMDIVVDIFTMEGKLINTIRSRESDTGYRSQNIYWDGSGAQNGESIYIYRIRASTSDGKTAEKSGKLIITR